ncbi:MAG TPA: ATP-binding protein [Rariglobus sp.]|jgi:PAS domain S-box-containing protein|nr:ATP-binding protein [Rariglobus sp.]
MKKRPTPAVGSELRRRAETSLRKQPAKDLLVETRAGTKHMLHELQVHQIELELQNEELQQAKAEVDANLEKYTDLYDFAPVGYFSIDEESLILEVNLTGAALLGVDRSHLVKRRFQLFMAPQNRAPFADFMKRIFAGHKKQVCEATLLRVDRPVFWADLQAMSAYALKGARKWCRLAVIDVSARKQAEAAQHRIDLLAATNRHLAKEITRRHAAETILKKSEQRALKSLKAARDLQERLRRMTHQLLMVEEAQRKEISRELHDKICQLLVGINVHLAIFAETATRKPKQIGRMIVPLRRLVEEGVKIVHKFARDLRPSALDDLGLIPALRSYIDDFQERKGRKIELIAVEGVEVLNNDKRTILYRVAQEALVNAAKHAGASLIKVTITKAKDGVCLEISDNGKGFCEKRPLSAKGRQRLGMIGMRERVEMVGGRFTVTSKPGMGVVIQALIPVD